FRDTRGDNQDAVAPFESELMKETGGAAELACELAKGELLFAAVAFVKAPKRQRIGALPGPPLDHIAGEIEVGWNGIAHERDYHAGGAISTRAETPEAIGAQRLRC